MNENELKRLWQQQPLREPAISPAQVMSAMQNKASQLRGTLLARDITELSACVFVGVVFGIYYFIFRAPIMRLGALITVAGAIFIAGKLLYARRTTPVAKADATVVESLRAELHSVRTQAQLLRSILWWYLLPLAFGTLVFVWGMSLGNLAFDLVFKIGFTLVTLALDVRIYRLNQRAVAKQLLPVEAQLESLLRSAETGEPLDEAHVANLRPIVLSMKSAGQVKLSEFKVAFWQIALFGEIGFIGMWFCLMLGLAGGIPSSKTNEPSPALPVPIVHVDETNRYSVVARKVVDLFNAGDYAALQKLYNPEMSKAFPPRTTSEFYTKLFTRLGKVEKLDGPTGNGYRGWTAFRLQYQRSELIMSVALDADDKISGIYFQPARKPLKIGWFVHQIFGWRRLIWIVPFFLGGLLFSRLIQKTTDRAVGISTLGIHLCKGQTLVLWEEIKEVRPLKFLHVRNLWLISEAGEKTLMHWTPLERHLDLKAAVESFAPANHPIRKYLFLLKGSGPK
jgi:hypothetical protein